MIKRSLILGGAVIASTIVSLALSSGWAVMAGPLLMCAVLLWIAVSAARRKLVPADRVYAAAAVCGGLVLASAIVAVADPFYVSVMIPILAGPAAGVLAMPRTDSAPNC